MSDVVRPDQVLSKEVVAIGGDPSALSMGRVLRAAPGLLRLATTSGWHFFEWTVKTSVDTGRDVVQTLASGALPSAMIGEFIDELKNVGRQALGLAGAGGEVVPARPASSRLSTTELRARGAELLYQSADVWFTEDVHPAFERILGEMAPDEARILRFLATEGPQPAIDVRTGRPLGIGSELIEAGLSMIGLRAGVRNMGRTNAHQNNLFRLGLIWFSREEVDPVRYQVLEVQPDVADALKRAGRMPKIVRRSIHLTPFGEDFCRNCLPIGEETYWNGRSPES
jgi:hypothetical protein